VLVRQRHPQQLINFLVVLALKHSSPLCHTDLSSC
jgi:hypothetical protein